MIHFNETPHTALIPRVEDKVSLFRFSLQGDQTLVWQVVPRKMIIVVTEFGPQKMLILVAVFKFQWNSLSNIQYRGVWIRTGLPKDIGLIAFKNKRLIFGFFHSLPKVWQNLFQFKHDSQGERKAISCSWEKGANIQFTLWSGLD